MRPAGINSADQIDLALFGLQELVEASLAQVQQESHLREPHAGRVQNDSESPHIGHCSDILNCSGR